VRRVLILMALLVTAAVAMVPTAGVPVLVLLVAAMLAAMGGGLIAGAAWLPTMTFALVLVEIGLGLLAGSVRPEWIPYLAAGLFLAAELAVSALEASNVVEAPRGPARRRILSVCITTLAVWLVASAVNALSGVVDETGALTQIAGVTAAAAVLATLRLLLTKFVAD
jgi:hypothetical protein